MSATRSSVLLVLAGLGVISLASACMTTNKGAKVAAADQPAAKLSSGFDDNCSLCHGALGKGDSGPGPDLTNVDLATFKTVVRAGRTGSIGVMPPVTADVYSDANLLNDFTAITGKPAQ